MNILKKLFKILNDSSTIIVALASLASAYYAYSLTSLTKSDWETKKASISIFPSFVYLYSHGLWAAQFYNDGLTSAKDVKTFKKAFICDKAGAFPKQFINENFYQANKDNGEIIKTTINGKLVHRLDGFVFLTQSSTLLVRNNIKDIYFLGHAIYQDGSGKPREVRSCSLLGELSSVKDQVQDFKNCPLYNCSDDDCKNQDLKLKPLEQEQKCELYNEKMVMPKN